MKTSKTKNVLIVEDDENSYLYLLFALEECNYHVLRANDGLEAIDVFTNSNVEFDFILMDLKLPTIDGFKASEAIRKINPEVPIVAQTAAYLPQIEQKLKDYKFDGVITKPFTTDNLFMIIENALSIKKSFINTTS